MTTPKDLKTTTHITWCLGCGNFAILNGVFSVFSDLINEGTPKENIVLVSGIGCHGKIVDYIGLNTLYSIHGRSVPAMEGIKLANPDLTVVGFVGDGDTYGEGLAHLIFAAKRNIDISVFVHNNEVYALTTGQYSPTTAKGLPRRSTPRGTIEEPLNPIDLMIAAGATFVARAFVGDMPHLKTVLRAATDHQGFSVVDILQPSFVFNNTYTLYRENCYKLEDTGHDPADREAAAKRAREWVTGISGKVPIGIFYHAKKPIFDTLLLGDTNLRKEAMGIELRGFIEKYG